MCNRRLPRWMMAAFRAQSHTFAGVRVRLSSFVLHVCSIHLVSIFLLSRATCFLSRQCCAVADLCLLRRCVGFPRRRSLRESGHHAKQRRNDERDWSLRPPWRTRHSTAEEPRQRRPFWTRAPAAAAQKRSKVTTDCSRAMYCMSSRTPPSTCRNSR